MNKHGLTRDIPDPIKRAIRQRDGFGCVICGKAIYDYEHFDPEFADATSHRVDGIILLCIEHHGLKTRGMLSRDTVRRHTQLPKCKETGYSFGPFDLGTSHPNIHIGRMRCSNVSCILKFDGEELFSVSPPEKAGQPFLLTARIRNADGKTTLEVVDNEWRANSANWDVVVEGRSIVVRDGLGVIALKLRSDPPNHIYVERLNLHHKGHVLSCREGHDLVLNTREGAQFSTSEMTIDGSQTAIECDASGFRIGVGGGAMFVKSATIRGGAPPNSFNAPYPSLRAAGFSCWCGLKFPHTHGPRK